MVVLGHRPKLSSLFRFFSVLFSMICSHMEAEVQHLEADVTPIQMGFYFPLGLASDRITV